MGSRIGISVRHVEAMPYEIPNLPFSQLKPIATLAIFTAYQKALLRLNAFLRHRRLQVEVF